ncbi:MAG: hypothetical protein HC912_02435 [Saprospiraceae bacterium]|nr:hypothetical protein [Saprospiraceae bacterium]
MNKTLAAFPVVQADTIIKVNAKENKESLIDNTTKILTTKATIIEKEQEITDVIIPSIFIPLNSNSIKPILFSKNDYPIAIPINKIKKNNFQYGINAGMYYNFNQTDGLFGALFVKYKLAKKWQINVSSSYFQPSALGNSANDEAVNMDMDGSSGMGRESVTSSDPNYQRK